VVVGFALLWLDEPGARAPQEPGTLPEDEVGGAAPPDAAAITPNEIHELARRSFPRVGPVQLLLWLPVPAPATTPRPARIHSQSDGRVLEAQAAVSGQGEFATLEVDPDYLQPGTYLVEIDTDEPGHEGPRSYVILVR
jgi:hypothetical protein